MYNRISIVEVEPTVLFSAGEPLRQLAYLKLRNYGDGDIEILIRVNVEGIDRSPVSEATVKAGDNSIDIWIPDMKTPKEVTIQVTDKNSSFPAACWQGVWQPQRKWKIYLIKASHYDLGYDGRVDHMQAQAADYLDLAKRLCADKAQAHEWHYHLEHMGFIRSYERERKESEYRELIEKYLKTGLMTLLGNPSGPHWHWMDYEQIARASYPARREMKDRFGLEVESIAIVDNTSGSWAAYQAFARSGFKYVFRMANPFRSPGSFKDLGLPKIFRLECPNGKDKILFCLMDVYCEDLWIGQAGGYLSSYVGTASRELSGYLKKVESGDIFGEYPYDTLVVSNYIDWDIPHEDERILAKWRKEWRYPEIHLEDAGKALSNIEENYGDVIPVLRGDTNNCTGDYSSIDPLSQGIKRRTARMLPFLEGLYSIAARLDPQIQYPGKAFNDFYINLVEYDEHCWPTMLPGNDMNIFNTSIVKIHQAKKVHSKVTEMLNKPMAVILGNSSGLNELCTKGTVFTVWNSLAHPRSDLVRFHAGASFDEQIKACRFPAITIDDANTGNFFPAQMLETGEISFVARDIPAYGFKTFSARVQDISGDRNGSLPELSANENNEEITVQNRFYKLVVNKTSGKVVALEDRRSGRSLLDPQAPYAFNQWLRVSTGEFTYDITSKELDIRPIGSSTARLGPVGPVAAQVVVETGDKDIGARIITTYTLYKDLDRLDVSNKALRMDFLNTPAKDRYKENIFVSFPFNIEKPEFRVEHSTGTVNPETDLLPSVRDFMILNRWVDVSNGEYGITMVSHEAAAIHLGKIMYNQFSAGYMPEKSHIYSYVWSNRMAGLTALGLEDYRAELSYSIRSHEGDWVKGRAATFGWGQASPPTAVIMSPAESGIREGKQREYENFRSFVSIDCENIQMTVLKRAEKPGGGFVLRMVETEGRDCPGARIKISFMPVEKAWLCDMVENDMEELHVKNDIIELPIGSYDMATIRFTGVDESFVDLKHVDAKELGDSKIQLDWEYENEVPDYTSGVNVYRSEDPGFTPTIHTLAAYTEKRQYIDKSLKPGCTYYYHVAPANRDNGQGNLYGPVSARTTLENRTPPSPVEDLGVIPMDMDRLAVYWRRNPEPDVACYRVYRGDTPDFRIFAGNLIAVVEPDKYWYQTYMDTGLSAGATKYYKVFPVDYAGNVQQVSACVSGSTPLRERFPESRY